MTLIILLIVLTVQHYTDFGARVKRYPKMRGYLLWMQKALGQRAFWSSVWGVVVILLPLLVTIGLIQHVLSGKFLILVKFIFELLILGFCLQAYPLKNRLMNLPSIVETGEEFIRKGITPSLFVEKFPETENVYRAINREILLRANEQVFGIIFWFIVLGPAGAVFYFMMALLQYEVTLANSPLYKLLLPVSQIFGLVNWLPVRCAGLAYALIGHFAIAFHCFRQRFFSGIAKTRELGIQLGLVAAFGSADPASLEADSEETSEVFDLVDRAVVVWLVVVALFTLGGWI